MSFLPIILKVISEQPQIGGGGGSRSIISDSLRFPWTVAHQAPPSLEFSMQEYWSELLFPYPGDLSDPGIKTGSPTLQADSLPSEPPGKHKPWIMGSKYLITDK